MSIVWLLIIRVYYSKVTLPKCKKKSRFSNGSIVFYNYFRAKTENQDIKADK